MKVRIETMRDKIICLVGESGSGKSTIAELLEKEGYNYILCMIYDDNKILLQGRVKKDWHGVTFP